MNYKSRPISAAKLHRSCGACHECCVAPRVIAEGKPQWVPCRQLDAAGRCTIYDHRHAECVGFRCLWLRGHFLEGDRPDKSGVSGEIRPFDGEEVYFVRELRPGAIVEEPGSRVLRAMVQLDGTILVRRRDGTTQITGRSQEQAYAWLRRHPAAAQEATEDTDSSSAMPATPAVTGPEATA